MKDEIRKRIIFLRKIIFDLNQREFTKRISNNSRSRQSLAMMENGHSSPSMALVDSMIQNLHVHPQWILFGQGNIFFDFNVIDSNETANIGKRIVELRVSLNISIKDFSKLLGMSRHILGLIETHGKLPTHHVFPAHDVFDVFDVIINKIGVSSNWFFFGIGCMFLDTE